METVKKSKKNLKFTTIAWVLAAMLLAIVILVNVAVSFFDVKLDMTPNKMYTLNQTTVDYLNKIDKKVDIYLLMELDEIKNSSEANEMMAFTTMMDQYSEFENINFIDIDPDTNPDIVNELNPDGYLTIESGDIVVKCGNAIKKIDASRMYILEGYDENGNYVPQSFQGENVITGAIKSVVENYTPTIYFLTGHGEKSIDNYYTTFKRNLKDMNYEVTELNLSTLDAVPDDAAIIVAAAPKNDITDAEKEKLDEYMDKGGNLSLLMSPNGDNTDYKNLLEIMHEYCIGMDYNKIYETDDSKHVSGDKYQIMVDLVDINAEGNETLNANGQELTDLTSAIIEQSEGVIPYMPASRSFFDYGGDNYANLKICPLIQTYETAESQKFGGQETEDFVMNPPFYLSAYSEDPTRNDSKLVVMGNAEFMDDETLANGYTIVPLNLYIKTILWMSNSEIDMNIPGKENTYDYMTLESESDTNMILTIVIAAPVVVAAAGVLIWLKRRNS
ncbi:MAG: Gldg family protein [Porcipelethomonas sp.]